MKKNILVTGASGAIGEAVAVELQERGYNVIGTYRREPKSSLTIEWIKLDMTNEADLDSLANRLSSQELAGLVDCSGVHHSGPLMGLEDEKIRDMYETNLIAPTRLVQRMLPIFSRQRSGSIVLMGSVSAHRMTRGHAVYSATKAGLEGLIKALAAEMAKRNVRLNGVLPGPVDSSMLRASIQENGVDPKEMVPMGRLIKASEVARTCAFLISDDSSAITGSLIPVDGGYSLW